MVKETKQKQQKKAAPSKPINKKAKLSTESEKKSKSKRAQKKKQQQQFIEEPVIEEEEKVEVVEEEDPQEEMYDDDDNDDDGEELTFKKDGFMTIGENDDIDAVIAAIRAEDGDSESDDDEDGIIRDVEVKKGDENDYENDNDDNDDVNMDNGDDNDDFLEEELNDDVSKHEENEEEAKLRAKKKEERAMNIEKLKEEERLYKSHLFKLQIDELIKGCTPAYDGESGIATRFTSWLEGTFVPGLKGFAQKDVFVPIGSFASRMMTLHKDKRITIDVAVKIPDTAFDDEQQSDPSKNKKQSKKPKAKPKSYEFLKGDYMSKFAAAVEKGFGKVTSKMTSINGHYIFTTKDFDVAFYPAISKEVAAKYAAEAPAATAKDFLCAESAAFLRKCTVGCRGLRDAAVLVKVWLHQRSMDVLPDSLGSFALALVLGMLTEESRSNRQMTSYQLFVLAMETFGSGRVASPMMDPVLHKVDVLAHMTRQSMLELQQEAKATVECLQTSITPEGGFPEVFLTKIDPAWKYDCIINVDPAKTKTTAGEIVDLLLRAVGRRCFVIREIPELGHAAVGLVLDPSECTKCVERGPSADDNEGSKVFCDIWKSKAEVRRFKDGSIVQSVGKIKQYNTLTKNYNLNYSF